MSFKTGLLFTKPRTPLPLPGSYAPPQCPPIPPPTPRSHPPALDNPLPRLTTLVVDFDGTLTTHDTLSTIAALAGSSDSSINSCANEAPTWSDLVESYTNDLASTESAAATTSDLSTYLALFRPVEHRSIERVSASRVLSGINRPMLRAAGKGVELRAGSQRVLARWQEWQQRHRRAEETTLGASPAVVVNSVNWSKDLVSAQLDKSVVVLCNDLHFDESGGSTGVVEGDMLVAADKLKAVVTVCPGLDRCVAVGDSQTDLLVLLSAEIGILIAPSAETIQTCDRFEIELEEISHCPGASKRGSTLYVAADWNEIEQLLERMGAL